MGLDRPTDWRVARGWLELAYLSHSYQGSRKHSASITTLHVNGLSRWLRNASSLTPIPPGWQHDERHPANRVREDGNGGCTRHATNRRVEEHHSSFDERQLLPPWSLCQLHQVLRDRINHGHSSIFHPPWLCPIQNNQQGKYSIRNSFRAWNHKVAIKTENIEESIDNLSELLRALQQDYPEQYLSKWKSWKTIVALWLDEKSNTQQS